MPIYEYLCGACGHSLDALQKLSDEPLLHCPTCGEPQLKRQLSAPRFRLKGKGWYETDFKGQGDKKRNLAQSDSAPDSKPAGGDGSGGKSGEKSDSGKDKPAAKPAADSKPAGGKADSVA